MILSSDKTRRFQPWHRLVTGLPGLLGLLAIAPPAWSAEVCEPIPVADNLALPYSSIPNLPSALVPFPASNRSSNPPPSLEYIPIVPLEVSEAIARQDYDAIDSLLSDLPPFEQANTLIDIARLENFQGDRARLLNDALTIARSLPPDQPLPSDSERDFLLRGIFFAAFEVNEVDLALQALQEHSSREQQIEILSRVVWKPRAQGNWDAANALEDRLYTLLTSQPDYRAVGLSQVAALYAQTHQPEKSQRAFAEAIAMISAVEPGEREEAVMQRVSANLIAAGELEQAEEMMQILQDPAERQVDMAIALAERGQYRDSVARVSQIDTADPMQRMPELIRLLAERGQFNCAQQAAMLTELIPDNLRSVNLDLALDLAKAGRDSEAVALLVSWRNIRSGMEVLPTVTALVAAGEVDLAHDWALALPNPSDRLELLAALAQVLAQTGDRTRAAAVLAEAEQASLEALRAPIEVFPPLQQFMFPSLAPPIPLPALPALPPFTIPQLPLRLPSQEAVPRPILTPAEVIPSPSLLLLPDAERQRSLAAGNDALRGKQQQQFVSQSPPSNGSANPMPNVSDTVFQVAPPTPELQRQRQILSSRILAPAYDAVGQSQVAIAQLTGALQLVLAPLPSQESDDFDGNYQVVPLLQQYAQLSNPPLAPLLNLRQQILSERADSTQTWRLGGVAYGFALLDAPDEALATLPFADCSVFVQGAIVLSLARQQKVEQALQLAAQMTPSGYDRIIAETWVQLVGIFATTGHTDAAERVMTEILNQQYGNMPYNWTAESQRYGEQRLYQYAQRLILSTGSVSYSYTDYAVPDFQDLDARLSPQVQDLGAVAEIAVTNGDVDQALMLLRALPSDRDRARSLAHLAIALHAANQASHAETALAEAEAIAQNLPNHFGKVQVLLAISDARLQMGQPDRALAPLDQASEILSANF
ncbi:MAG TPA: hypothetical protein V6C88_07965 [Chroococcidiopsis sp.]